MYQIKNGFILRNGSVIPDDENNRDYAEYLRWIEAGNAPEVAATNLEEARAARKALVHQEKNRVRDSGFFVSGTRFDADIHARTAYAELALTFQMEPAFTVRWKASEGSWVTMNAALFAQVYAAGRAHIEACFAWQEARELEIDAAATVEAVQAVSVTM